MSASWIAGAALLRCVHFGNVVALTSLSWPKTTPKLRKRNATSALRACSREA
jgi:hypothetical protein